jgi:hypothetical protein
MPLSLRKLAGSYFYFSIAQNLVTPELLASGEALPMVALCPAKDW